MERIRTYLSGRKDKALQKRYFDFPPHLTYDTFTKLSPEVRQAILSTNPIIRTDTYNRTMEHLSGNEWKTPATYVLQMRHADRGYLITAGVEDAVRKVSQTTITQEMLDFATDYYRHVNGVSFFNPSMWQEVIDIHHGKLPFTIDCVPDGTAILPGDPVMRISGPNELVAHFEPDFHQAFYPTLVATNAHQIAQTIGANRFIEVGLRGAQTDQDHLTALKAAYIGGGITRTSNDQAFGLHPEFHLVGTIGHRKVQEFVDEEKAFRDAIAKLDSVTLLVDLNDAYNGIEIALRLKKEYRDQAKTIWMRLDSGDVGQQTVYALQRQREEGLLDPQKDKIVVEGIEAIEDMARIDQMVQAAGFDPKQFVLYGAGGLLISNHTTRADASTAFKLAQYDGRPTMKFSNSPGKESIPGQPTLVMTGGHRVIAQEGEYPVSASLFIRAYEKGRVYLQSDLPRARAQADASYNQLAQTLQTKSDRSSQTAELIENIRLERTRRDVRIYERR